MVGRKSKHNIPYSQYDNPTAYFREYYIKVLKPKVRKAKEQEKKEVDVMNTEYKVRLLKEERTFLEKQLRENTEMLKQLDRS